MGFSATFLSAFFFDFGDFFLRIVLSSMIWLTCLGAEYLKHNSGQILLPHQTKSKL